MKLLHIAAHIGGGIGAAYIGLGTCGLDQTILLLEPPQDQTMLSKVKDAGFHVLQNADDFVVERELRQADAVVFSWHHHPAMTLFLQQMPAIPIRSILWCHVSGNYFPHISADFVRKFDETIFATPFSLELPQICALGNAYLKKHCSVVYGLNDLSSFSQIRRMPHRSYTIGYVGTIGFCKLHPDFVNFCAAIKLPDVRFLMVGTPVVREQLLAHAASKGIADRFQFCGQVSDVAQMLAQMDAFGYLLNPQHFGATENALLEAMATGIPAIALNQCVERGIVRNRNTGLLVRSPEEYGCAIRYLYSHPNKAEQLGAAGRDDILGRYRIQSNRQRFLTVCKRALGRKKRVHKFDNFFIGEPADWFLSCVSADRVCFEENRAQDSGPIFHERTKGSPIHYHKYFPKDERLGQWAQQVMN